MKKILLALLCTYGLFAQEIAMVKLLKGKVSATMDSKVVNLEVGSLLDEKMIIQTSSGSSTTIVFNDNSILVLGENSILNLKKYTFKPEEKKYEFKLFLKIGAATFESGEIGVVAPESFTFEIPQGTVAIRGTKFAVKVD